MTVPVIAGAGFAIVAAVLAVVILLQRRALRRLVDQAETEHQTARGHGVAGADVARAMLAGMREPALLHRERIEAVNEAFATLAGIPVADMVGRNLADLVAPAYAELVNLAVTRVLSGDPGPR